MDTRNSRVALLQSQNNSPQLSVHSQPHGDAPSSLLRPHEHHHDGRYHYERTDVKYKQFRRSCRPGLSVVTQIALCIILLGFLALAGLAIWMDGHPTGTTLGDRIEEALKVGSTVYTMVFAALLPEALKNIGRFKAQKGTALWSLWNLMNTNSITDPITNWWHYRTKPLILILVIICLLSPLGSQSTLRLVKHSDSPSSSYRTIRYLDSGPVGNIFPNFWACDQNEFQYPVSTRDTYLAALMQGSDTKQGPRDQWGNVKIPRLPDPSSSEADSDGWFQVPNGTANPERYASLSGIAIIGLANLDKEDVEFTVGTSYVELDCLESHFMSNDTSRGGLSVTCPDCGLLCATGAYNRTAAFLGPPFPGLTATQLADPSMTRPRSIVFNSTVFNGEPIGFLQTTCQVTQQHVETQIECTGNECQAIKIRSSRTDHRSENYTSFDDWGGFALDVISRSSGPGSIGVGDDPSISSGPSTSELFLQNSSTVPAPSTYLLIMEGSTFNLSTISIDVFATRASILLNTALQVFTCPSCFAGNFPSNTSIYGPDYIPADGMAVMWKTYNLTMGSAFDGAFAPIAQAPFMAASTNATVTSHTEVYRPVYWWIGGLAGSVAVIFSMGLYSLCLRAKTRIPNVFDPVMGLTYNNEYMPSTYQEGELDSEDRAKLLQNERVRFGAVECKDTKARIAFGEEAMISVVDKNTWYHESI